VRQAVSAIRGLWLAPPSNITGGATGKIIVAEGN
jgi:hypothetical protein